MPALSVIIPVYNASQFLPECLDSVLSQSFCDIEVICVDDGSTEQSGIILDYYGRKDTRLRVIHKDNAGLSSARNVGLKLSSGEFVAFIDADDMVDSQMYSVMLDYARKYDLDSIGCCFITMPDGKVSGFDFKTGTVLSFSALLSSSLKVESSNDLCLCWRYLFKRTILEKFKVSFREDIKFAEDMVFVTEALAHCKRIFLLDKPLYHYRIGNQNSLMGNTKNPERLTAIPLGYAAKKEQIKRFAMDDYSPCSRDLSEYTIKTYLPMLLNALPDGDMNNIRQKRVKSVLSMPMIRESCHAIGFRNIYSSWKEYFFYLSVKFKLAVVVNKLWFR